jgi:hypothetical protein
MLQKDCTCPIDHNFVCDCGRSVAQSRDSNALARNLFDSQSEVSYCDVTGRGNSGIMTDKAVGDTQIPVYHFRPFVSCHISCRGQEVFCDVQTPQIMDRYHL